MLQESLGSDAFTLPPLACGICSVGTTATQGVGTANGIPQDATTMTNLISRWSIGRPTACRCIDISTFRLVLTSHFQIPLRNRRSSGQLWCRNGVSVAELRLIQVSQPQGARVHFSAATSGPHGRKRQVTGSTIHRFPSARLNHVELTEPRYGPSWSTDWIDQSFVAERLHSHRLMRRHVPF